MRSITIALSLLGLALATQDPFGYPCPALGECFCFTSGEIYQHMGVKYCLPMQSTCQADGCTCCSTDFGLLRRGFCVTQDLCDEAEPKDDGEDCI